MTTYPHMLIDGFGRTIDYIRLSITDRCDFRCQYCMGEDVSFLPRDDVLSLEECSRIVSIFLKLGVTKVRITGGEPLVRKNAMWLFESIGQMPGLAELVTTTNGSQLNTFAMPLKKAGVSRINISLDSLNPSTFQKITRVGRLEQVLAGIEASQKAGFRKIKLNTVLMKGLNDHELFDLIDFSIHQNLDISFIEEMPIGEVNHSRLKSYMSNDEVLARIKTRYQVSSSAHATGGPAKYWEIEGTNTQIGLISPHSHNFCDSCNRVRISCKGELFFCLGQEDKLELMPLLRANPHEDQPIMKAIIDSMQIKPERHSFNLNETKPAVIRFMSHTGG
jgi:GTP 3',8-cyclase